ncbi:MAG: single-stranded-DNA-specific exonuclease RecJ [Bacteroidota bacterium]
MKFKWQLPPKNVSIDEAVLDAVGGRKVLAQLLVMRGISTPGAIRQFLDSDAYTPAPPDMLHDMAKGVERIERAIRAQELILVWGDFDVDGQTSTALLVEALQHLGANVTYYVPIRAEDGHGIKPATLQRFLDRGINVLLSCDTGIAAVDAVELANAHGVDVVITDHHDLPDVLPAAYASINPKFHKPDHPHYGLPGVGVAYKLIEALYTRAGCEADLPVLLDLVALGIVADIANQAADTRFLLQQGLEVLRTSRRRGLQSIMKRGNVLQRYMIDEDIGFKIGPRLNAVGRLKDANVSVDLLTTSNAAEANRIADDLEALNRERRRLTEDVYDSALGQIDRDPSLLQYAALVLDNPKWHQGVIGIVASRLVEEFGKPTILLASPPGEPARGSARSIEGYHITEAITTQADYLLGFGGHPMAAGMALPASDIERFRRGVSKAIVAQRNGKVPESVLDISLVLPISEITPKLADEVELMAPFGAGNPPVNYLCREVVVTADKLFGKDKSHRKLYVSDGACDPVEVIWWGGAEKVLPEGTLDIVFRMRPGYFRNEPTLQVTLLDLQRADRLAAVQGRVSFEIIDWRDKPEPALQVEKLRASHEQVCVWGEVGPVLEGMVSRADLVPADVLVIWTLPPDRSVLLDVLNFVKPSQVYVVGQHPGMDIGSQFLKRLAGLVKYTISNYNGETRLDKLAAATAHTTHTVKAGLARVAELGIGIRIDDSGGVRVTLDVTAGKAGAVDDLLETLLREAAAYRQALGTTQKLPGFLR